jgi:hypothetical protein
VTSLLWCSTVEQWADRGGGCRSGEESSAARTRVTADVRRAPLRARLERRIQVARPNAEREDSSPLVPTSPQ